MTTLKVYFSSRGITGSDCAVHSVRKSLKPLLSQKTESIV